MHNWITIVSVSDRNCNWRKTQVKTCSVHVVVEESVYLSGCIVLSNLWRFSRDHIQTTATPSLNAAQKACKHQKASSKVRIAICCLIETNATLVQELHIVPLQNNGAVSCCLTTTLCHNKMISIAPFFSQAWDWHYESANSGGATMAQSWINTGCTQWTRIHCVSFCSV